MSNARLQAALKAKLATIVSGADKRAEIVIEQTPDALDQVQFATERDLAVALLNRDCKMSRRVQEALGRMEDGRYGVCLACEDPISDKRLQAVPWAEFCLGCQERADQVAAGVLSGHSDEMGEVGVE
jgi:DnaK suppressor protein